jgi:hypothetical protein
MVIHGCCYARTLCPCMALSFCVHLCTIPHYSAGREYATSPRCVGLHLPLWLEMAEHVTRCYSVHTYLSECCGL